ncbi:conserved hypothetical protein [Talaromyces stipitatus ATCC 10500]|uniref:Uncharacterized protein n=1 Tax=Talaromyces stipitatus (strain ATCC 10500 / CBS 375.48 / QM 6759 / NRRL 1006) TaxID=441959 RepID=B8MMV6_TALSN|nr:uncharacterized protein TSTA_100990 [Talaromyces stipitatus ATCC 10500]EED13859.1 conserved hypothetical protein [Talaromyces stipitatus ATCC 10500]
MATEDKEDLLDFNAKKMDDQMGELLDSFESHPLMQPPDTHPTLFFIFDFIRNTRKELRSIDINKLREGDSETKKQVVDVMGRNGFANALINDSTGRLAVLTGGDPGNPVGFGSEIKEGIARLVGRD